MPHDIAEDARDARWIAHHRQVPGFERCERKLLEFIARALERLGGPVIESGNLGEISAAWVSALGRWLLIGTRDKADHRQLVYYTAKDPRGPWDGPLEIFAASVDRKLDADLFHRAWTSGSFESDRLYDKGQGEGGGIEYGGYIVERYIKTVRPGVADVYFTVSTWNPYQVALMCARFVRGDDFRDETFHFVDTLALNVLDETVRELAQIAEKSQVEAPVREIVSAGHLLLDRIAAVVEPRSAAGLTLRRVRDAAKLAGEFAERAVLGRGRVAREVGGVALIQSNFGRLHHNFEVAAPATQGGIRVRAGSNDGNSVSWGATLLEGATTPRMYFDALAMLQSTVPDPVDKPPPAERWSGRLIVAGNDDGRLAFLWRERDAPFRWHGPFPVIAVDDSTDARAPFTRVRGNPALIQSTFGLRRNDFELIAPAARAGIRHYHQDNRRDLPFSPDWQVGETFCEHLGLVDAVSMIQGAFGDPGNLEVVARCGSRLHHCWRAGNAWGDGLIRVGGRAVEGVSGIPALALSRFGKRSRNFELLTPLIAGGLAHYFRDNDPEGPGEGSWHFVEIVDPGTIYLSVSLVHSTIGDRGLNLEAVALTASGEVVRVSRSVTAGHFQRLELLFSI